MLLALIVLLPLLGAGLPALLARVAGVDPARTSAGLAALSLAILLSQAGAVLDGERIIQSAAWIPEMGLSFSFRLDGFALLFALLILFIGLLVIVYARFYLHPDEPKERFYGFLMLFMGAMLGVVMAENLILLAMFWELTSLSSFLLIGFWRHRAEARQGARLALLITGAGGFALLAAVLLLGDIVGSFELSAVLAAGPLIKAHPLYELVLGLVLLAAFTKSAQFPFHFWLPNAMSAPTPVSAYLHSATMVKAGLFLIGRLFPALAGTEIWFLVVSGVGLTTQLMASYIALFKHDLKGLLAYSTVSHLGLVTLLFGLGTPLGEIAAVFHIINHAVFKASLFMAAGIVDHEAGTRDMRRLSGLFRYMPQTAILATVAASAMAGVPLLNGFLSKEMYFAETLQVQWLGSWYWVLPVTATLAGVFTVAYSARFVHNVFFGSPPAAMERTPHDPPLWMKVPVAMLVALCLLVGALPSVTVDPLLRVAAGAVLGGALPDYDIKLWHGFGLPLLMSAIALAGGAALYGIRRYRLDLHGHQPSAFTGKLATEWVLERTIDAARSLTGLLENGSLQRYMLLLLLAALALAAYGLAGTPLTGSAPRLPADALALAVAAIGCIAALATAALHRQRLVAVIAVGVVGLVVTLAFVRFSAPDLALTQILVEIATVILLLLWMYFIPARSQREPGRLRHGRDIAVAALAGVGAAALCLASITRPFESLSGYYLDKAKSDGGGYNVVNVILVDFRGFDTLGEITVLGIAAIGILAMLRGLRPAAPQLDWDGRAWAPDRYPVMLAVIARPLLPLALLVCAELFLRGHNAPGGGFIAGLVAGTAIIVQYIAHGSAWARERIGSDFAWLIAAGVLTAVATGLASWAFDAPFLTSTFGYLSWPVVGTFEVASALLFDLGVFLVVVGTVLVILASLGELSADPVAPARRAAAMPATGEG